jgi:hypothetical protein
MEEISLYLWNRRFLHVCDRSGFLQGTRTGENLCWSYRRNKGLVAALRQMRRTRQGKQIPPTPTPPRVRGFHCRVAEHFFLFGCVVRPDGFQIQCISPEQSDWSWNSVLTCRWSGVRIKARKIIFIFFKTSRMALGPTQPPSQWVRVFCPGD